MARTSKSRTIQSVVKERLWKQIQRAARAADMSVSEYVARQLEAGFCTADSRDEKVAA